MAGLGSIGSLMEGMVGKVVQDNTRANKKIKLIFFKRSNESYF